MRIGNYGECRQGFCENSDADGLKLLSGLSGKVSNLMAKSRNYISDYLCRLFFTKDVSSVKKD